MDPFTTPIKRSTMHEGRHVFTKDEVIDFIDSFDFPDIEITTEVTTSEDEVNRKSSKPLLRSSHGTILKYRLDKRTPSRSKYLKEGDDRVQSDDKTGNISFLFENFLTNAESPFQEEVKEEIHNLVGTAVSTLSKQTSENEGNPSFLGNSCLIAADTKMLKPLPEHIVSYMIEHADEFFPESKKKSHTKPSAKRNKITMSYNNVPPLPEHIAKKLANEKKEMEKYESHPTFLCLDVSMKENTRLPFVQILNPVVHPYPEDPKVTKPSIEAPEEVRSGIMNGDVECLWDTGCVVTRICADTIGHQTKPGTIKHGVLTFKYVLLIRFR